MARRLRPLGLKDLDNLPCACEGCVYWESPELLEVRCGAACDLERLKRWYSDTTGVG